MAGWKLDLEAIYGYRWRRRERFHLREWLAEAPGGDAAVLFYGIGEVGVNRQIGWLAVLRNKDYPELIFRSRWRAFWFEGFGEDPVRFDEGHHLAFVYEYVRSWSSKKVGARLRVIDLAIGQLKPL